MAARYVSLIDYFPPSYQQEDGEEEHGGGVWGAAAVAAAVAAAAVAVFSVAAIAGNFVVHSSEEEEVGRKDLGFFFQDRCRRSSMAVAVELRKRAFFTAATFSTVAKREIARRHSGEAIGQKRGKLKVESQDDSFRGPRRRLLSCLLFMALFFSWQRLWRRSEGEGGNRRK